MSDSISRNLSVNEFMVKYVEMNLWELTIITIYHFFHTLPCVEKIMEGKI